MHELERRDNECRRLNTEAINSTQKLEVTSDKLQSLETKSLIQAKEIKVRNDIRFTDMNEKNGEGRYLIQLE